MTTRLNFVTSDLESKLLNLLEQRPIPVKTVVAEMSRASLLADEGDLSAVVRIAQMDDVYDQLVAYPAMALMPAWGDKGLAALAEMAAQGPNRTAALSVLAAVCLGRVPTSADLHFLREDWDQVKKYQLPNNAATTAIRALRETILDQLTDSYRKSDLLASISHQALFAEDNKAKDERLDLLLDMLIDSRLILNRSMLEEFERLLADGPGREEDLHQFLVSHPILLDPFVSEIRSKHELGSDFITDFVLRRTNDQYVLVEIENSTDHIFNNKGNFSGDLSIAIGQVRDFQAWVSDNIAYAQSKLPNIRHPDGLVVIGRKTDLTLEMERRLLEERYGGVTSLVFFSQEGSRYQRYDTIRQIAQL